MTVGTVPLDLLRQRRTNYRKMNDSEMSALRASVGKFGFKTFIVVTTGDEPGTYDVVDGHHRWAVAKERNMTDVPVVVLDKEMGKDSLDLAMLSFNVTADIIPEVYVDFLHDLGKSFGPEMVSEFTGVDVDFLNNLSSSFDTAMRSIEEGSSTETGEGDMDKSRASFSVSIPATAENQALLKEVMLRLGLPTPKSVFVWLLKDYLARTDRKSDAIQ